MREVVPIGSFCPRCGNRFPVPSPCPPAYYHPQPSSVRAPERNWAIGSVVLGMASFIVLPTIFTPAGVILGAVSLSKKSEGNTLAFLGIVLSLPGLVASFVVNLVLL
jgi:hypothetical protein